MKIIAKTENSDIATVYIAETAKGKFIEFVESVQPPIPREKKWVMIISTLYGCPVSCSFCDCGYYYKGKVSADDMFAQIDFLINSRYHAGNVPVEKCKIQFARMGEPAFNYDVINVLNEIPVRYQIPGFVPSISTIAPNGTDKFFDKLLELKNNLYHDTFQLQFSIHTTNDEQRDEIIPVKKWDFTRIARYGEKFHNKSGKKISLNFALADNYELNPEKLINYFNPEYFLIKITPVNPTYKSYENNIQSLIKPDIEQYEIIDKLKARGYQVILSIGEWEENKIGSNCGQYVMSHLEAENKIDNIYQYSLDFSKN